MEESVLVLPGGFLRSVFTAGVLARLEGMGIRFTRIFAVSSSVPNACYLSAGALAQGSRVWRELVSGDQLVKRVLGVPVSLDIDHLMHCFLQYQPIPLAQIGQNGLVTAILTNLVTGEQEGLEVTADNFAEIVRLAVAIPPFIAPGTHKGAWFGDGGIVNPVPIQYALDRGHKKIAVVMTHPRAHQPSEWEGQVWSRIVLRCFPNAQTAFRRRARQYTEAQLLIENPPPGVCISAIYPPADLHLSRFMTDPQALNRAFDAGYREASRLAF